METFKELFEKEKKWGVYKQPLGKDLDAQLIKTYSSEKSAKKASQKLEQNDDTHEYYWGLI